MKTLVSRAIRRWRRRNSRKRSIPNSAAPSEHAAMDRSHRPNLELLPCETWAFAAPALSYRGPPPVPDRRLAGRGLPGLPAELQSDSSKKRLPAPCFTFYHKVKDLCYVLSLLHLNALPERHESLDLLRRRLGLRIKPRRSGIPLALDFHVVVTRRALPRTHRVGIARLEIFLTDRIRRKILIPLHLDRRIAFGQHRAFQGCFCHNAHID